MPQSFARTAMWPPGGWLGYLHGVGDLVERSRRTPAAVVQEARLKGVNFHGTLGALERRYGRDAVDAVKQRVPGEAGEALRTGVIVSGGWYPAHYYDALLATIEAEHPAVRGLIHDLSYEAVTHDFQTIFRVVSLIARPEWALQGASRVMTRYIEGGQVDVREAREGTVHFVFSGFHGYTRRMWEDFIAGLEAVIDMMRVKRLPTKIVSGGLETPGCELIIRYTR